MADTESQRREPSAHAHIAFRLSDAGSSQGRHSRNLAKLYDPQRQLEIQLGQGCRPASYRLFPYRLQRPWLGHNDSARNMGTQRLRRSSLRQHRLCLARRLQKQPSRSARDQQPRGFIPPHRDNSRQLERQADHSPLRIGHLQPLPVGQRQVRRLQRGQQARA